MEIIKTGNSITGHGSFQDGSSTDIERVEISFSFGEINFCRRDMPKSSCRAEQTIMSSHMEGVPLRIKLPDGGLLTIDDGELARAISKKRSSSVSKLEQNFLRLLLPMLVGSIAVFWFIIQFIIPPFAHSIAQYLPVSIANSIGDNFFASMAEDIEFDDDLQFKEFASLVLNEARPGFKLDEGEEDYNFNFLMIPEQSNVGQEMLFNAFALPNGHIIFGEDLYGVLNEEERYAVIAHEISHVLRRHSLETLIRFGVWYVLGAFLAGDFLFLTVPILLSEFSYSRDAEAEADCDAALQLKQTGRNPLIVYSVFDKLRDPESINEDELAKMSPEDRQRIEDLKAEIERMKKERNEGIEEQEEVIVDDEEKDQGFLFDILATHPPLEERGDLVVECLEANA